MNMSKETRNQILFSIIGIALVILGIYAFSYTNKPEIPIVGEDGKISGEYVIGGIMRLEKPYVCNFEKSDSVSKILGVIHTDGTNLYGEFKITTDLVEGGFDSFLVVNNNRAYTWTSIQNVGYESPVAKSAIKNASVQEQAQIIGINDKVEYECNPWLEVDTTLFETPDWVTFPELNYQY